MCRIWMDEDRVLHREPLATLELALVEAIELVGRLTLARRPARLRRLVTPHGGSVVSLDKVLEETKAIGLSPYADRMLFVDDTPTALETKSDHHLLRVWYSLSSVSGTASDPKRVLGPAVELRYSRAMDSPMTLYTSSTLDNSDI